MEVRKIHVCHKKTVKTISWYRWGVNSKETAAIKKYLETQNVDTRAHPLVGGLEVDLPALYHAVQAFGGLSEVIMFARKVDWSKNFG